MKVQHQLHLVLELLIMENVAFRTARQAMPASPWKRFYGSTIPTSAAMPILGCPCVPIVHERQPICLAVVWSVR